jgi:hypothetical protein
LFEITYFLPVYLKHIAVCYNITAACPYAIPEHMALPFIEHYGGHRIDALRIVAPKAAERASLEKDICSYPGPVVQ